MIPSSRAGAHLWPLLLLAARPAVAKVTTFRIATVAPDGTAGRASCTPGRATSSRSPTARCASRSTSAASPARKRSWSLKVARVVGVFQSREENSYVLSRLKPVLDEEFLKAGFINFGEAGLGPELLFTREPIADLAALRKLRLWVRRRATPSRPASSTASSPSRPPRSLFNGRRGSAT